MKLSLGNLKVNSENGENDENPQVSDCKLLNWWEEVPTSVVISILFENVV